MKKDWSLVGQILCEFVVFHAIVKASTR